MGTSTVSKTYRCFHECDPSGCPGHVMEASYQRTSDVLRVAWGIEGRPEEFLMDVQEVECLRDLIAGLGAVVAHVGEFRPSTEEVTYD